MEPYSSSDDELELILPMNVRDQDIQVENSEGVRSNRFEPDLVSAPFRPPSSSKQILASTSSVCTSTSLT